MTQADSEDLKMEEAEKQAAYFPYYLSKGGALHLTMDATDIIFEDSAIEILMTKESAKQFFAMLKVSLPIGDMCNCDGSVGGAEADHV